MRENPTAEAFTRKAAVYDAFGENHPNLARMRGRVREHILDLLSPGSRLLELNAGTGADAAHLAEAGYRVLATDISPGMLARARAKAAAPELGGRMAVRSLSFTDLAGLDDGPFELVYSNMGGLNCIPDLRPVARALQRLLLPGGYAVFVIMPRVCPWEWLALLKGDARTALRRLRPGGTVANVEGIAVQTYYFTARETERVFGKEFTRTGLETLAFAAPPADHKTFAHRRPRLFKLLVRIDDRIAGLPPFNGWGDFFMLTMRRRK
ncbi:MAG TPA: class I SAM-dependent methyltransferase [Anaerolineales bacterium]|nr:class I SAM-dependent methyltransferase [Anaerolineales bacterium]